MTGSNPEAELLNALPDGGPSEWSIDQIRQWTENRYVAHHEYARAALRKLLAERDELAAKLEIAINSHADGQWMRLALEKIRELDHIKSTDIWQAMCTAEEERDLHLRQLLDVERAQAPEIVICAAIRLPDGRVIRGHRHGDAIRTAAALVDWQHKPESGVNGPPWHPSMCEDQGFVTSRNRYVGREEGLRLQLAAGIPSADPSGYRARQLFSEDLY